MTDQTLHIGYPVRGLQTVVCWRAWSLPLFLSNQMVGDWRVVMVGVGPLTFVWTLKPNPH